VEVAANRLNGLRKKKLNVLMRTTGPNAMIKYDDEWQRGALLVSYCMEFPAYNPARLGRWHIGSRLYSGGKSIGVYSPFNTPLVEALNDAGMPGAY